MAQNLVVQLLLKTGAFSTDLKTARGQIQNFQQGCQTAGKSLDAFGKAIGIDIGALTKFGGAVGIAVAAGKGLKAVIDSNQTSADAFQAVMYSAKTAVNELAYSIGTFDFTNFNDGLTGLINRAKRAAQEIDQLGDTIRGYNVLEAEAQAAIAHARAVSRDKTKTKEQKEEANQAAREAVKAARDGAQEAADQYVRTLAAELREKGAQVEEEEVFGLVKKAVVINAQAGREAGKARAAAEYEEYQKKLSSLNREFGGEAQTFSTNYGTFNYNNDAYKQNPEYQSRLKELTEQYKESIVLNAVLVKQTDEQQDHTRDMLISVYRLNETVDTMDSRLEGIENKVDGTTTSTQKQEEVIKESLTYWQKMAQEAQKNRDATVYMSDAWKEANNQLDEALRKIELITAAMERAKTNAKYGDAVKDMLTPITGTNLTGKAESTKTPGLNGETKKNIEDIERSLATYQEVQKKTYDPELLAHYNQKIKELRAELERMNNLGIEMPTPDSNDSKKWDSFNSAMASTSTIVSNLADTFQEGTKVTTASILKMVSTSLPALSSLIGTIAALAGVEATAKAVETSQHWIEAIAAVAALGAAVAAAISMSMSHKAKFANGGIVGGSSFTGDRVTAQVNSGEMILNKTQQARLFKLANGGAVGGNQVEFHISGTELVGVLNNMNRKNRLIQ